MSHLLGHERVHLPLFKVAGTPFDIQGGEVIKISLSTGDYPIARPPPGRNTSLGVAALAGGPRSPVPPKFALDRARGGDQFAPGLPGYIEVTGVRHRGQTS